MIQTVVDLLARAGRPSPCVVATPHMHKSTFPCYTNLPWCSVFVAGRCCRGMLAYGVRSLAELMLVYYDVKVDMVDCFFPCAMSLSPCNSATCSLVRTTADSTRQTTDTSAIARSKSTSVPGAPGSMHVCMHVCMHFCVGMYVKVD